MGILAGLLLVVFGALYFRKPIQKNDSTIEIKEPSAVSTLLRGFFLNILNPAVWLIWLGNVTAVSNSLNFSIFKMVIYFSITLGLVLLVEFAKIRAAEKVKQFLTDKIMQTINIITGVLLIIFGVVLAYNHYF
jgi:threonine/homoserine/homoserine lactone efflux protein